MRSGAPWQGARVLRSWNQALALAPLVLGVVACSGEEAPQDAGAAADSGQLVQDAGAANDASIADAGFVDAAIRDGGLADAGTPDSGEPADAGNPNCMYPAGAVEPMALNEVITPYRWQTALDGAGAAFDLDLTKVHCANDEDIDWSPFDVLLFVSIPAW